MNNNEMENKYDVIIIWAWSAWLPAGMYASRYKLKNLIIGAIPWWALWTSHMVENYPGTISAPGGEIMKNFMEHAKAAGSEMKTEFVTELVECDYGFGIRTQSGNEYEAKKVILATGNKYRKLWIPWEERYLWKWVSYCATCDGMFFRGRELVVVWWWNTAFVEALYLSEIASKVHILYRWDKPKAEKIWQEKAKEKENIEIHLNTEVEEIRWEDFVTNLLLKSWDELKADWVFVAIWTIPDTKIVDTLSIKKDEEWCIIVDQRQESSIKWLYAAGDVTTNSNKFRQTIMSAAEGCLAANSVHEDIIKEW